VLRAVVLFFFLCCILCCIPGHYSLTTSLVVCDLCYEGSLVAASCNSLLLMKNRLYSPIEKKWSGATRAQILWTLLSGSNKLKLSHLTSVKQGLDESIFLVWLFLKKRSCWSDF
jgi:hypothetical protein